jgi:NAD-dependent SIR2 family protein deacetylase
MKKTVYILGAGFSMDAGAPSQSGLSKAIFELKNLLNSNENKKLISYFETLEDFLTNQLNISKEQFPSVPLEDIFTPIDRCIVDRISFKGIEPQRLEETRERIYTLIILALRQKLIDSDNGYIQDFANHLVVKSQTRLETGDDPVSVITTNWDILLDNALQDNLNLLRKPTEDFAGVVDYCCYVSSLDEEDSTVKPGLQAIGMGKFNVKLLKLHGSMNWLHCPKCQRVFVKFYQKTAGDIVFHDHHCRHCRTNYSVPNNKSIRLRSNLIMPTFLKDFNNFQIKLVWQNAGIEISEAEKLVFIGYSLPQADFELRQLLARMVRKDAQIEVVLSKNDIPIENLEWAFPETRYRSFFGNREISFNYDGAKKYLENKIL